MTRVDKKKPLRTCIACGLKAPQDELLRLALVKGEVRPDPARRLNGRGAYICKKKECVEHLARYGKKKRVFRSRLDENAWVGLIEILTSKAVSVPSDISRGA
ncbi:YlxR family protein [Dethiosulfatarculus sandiegensis]|uniref:YlxR domain-containing protein n=1 Tax=Dethiosulfatarculus sandiegensis TaxID=1429043 RepID=A0A0D2IZN4_9BACT|nr:YlxR family protein [Dethiosulfatarculus sandiegensis]KIX11459.1 hypothetical protein X474_24770 [Dethiosulfatarculus sandiegensis]